MDDYPIKLDYDDQPDRVVFKLNKALAKHGLAIEDDGKEYDGFTLHRIVVTEMQHCESCDGSALECWSDKRAKQG